MTWANGFLASRFLPHAKRQLVTLAISELIPSIALVKRDQTTLKHSIYLSRNYAINIG